MSAAPETGPSTVDVDLVAAQFDALDRETHRTALREAIRARDVYRRLVEDLKDQVEKLQQGSSGPRAGASRGGDDPQLSLHILAELLGRSGVEGEDAQKLAQELLAAAEKEAEACAEGDAADGDAADGAGGDGEDGDSNDDPKLHHRPRKPTGRRTARKEVIHKVTIERLPEEVQRLGLDAFERIGEDRMTTTERRVAALFEVTVIRPKFRAKTDAAAESVKHARTERRHARGGAAELDHAGCCGGATCGRRARRTWVARQRGGAPLRRPLALQPVGERPVCAIVGIGAKNGAAFARTFHAAGYRLALLSRTTDLSNALAAELGAGDAKAYACDATSAKELAETFDAVRTELGDPEVLIYNAGSGSWKAFDDTTADDLERSFHVNALGLMIASQAVLPAMRRANRGSIIVVGATASLRGKPMTTGFAAGKAAQRSLAQSMARQFWPEGVHVSLLIIDGRIGSAGTSEDGKTLDPNDIAAAALSLTRQPASAWTFEIDLRPKQEPW